jgi:hypothetical protein
MNVSVLPSAMNDLADGFEFYAEQAKTALVGAAHNCRRAPNGSVKN